MGKNLGFTRFEFYFVIAAIGLVISVGIQRYLQLAEETKRLNFEVIAKNFNAAVYNHHARWIMTQQQEPKVSRIKVEGTEFQFSSKGWPLFAATNNAPESAEPIKRCLSLWNNLLRNSPSISYNNENTSESFTYHLSLTPQGNCRFELITIPPQEYYFEYIPESGEVTIYMPPITNNS